MPAQRRYRVIELPAADVRAAARHISAQPPTPCNERRALRAFIESTKPAR